MAKLDYSIRNNKPMVVQPRLRPVRSVVKKKKTNPFARVRLFIFCCLLFAFVLPSSFSSLWNSLLINRIHNSAVLFEDMEFYTHFSDNYITKNTCLGSVQKNAKNSKKAVVFSSLYNGGSLGALENRLLELNTNKSLTPYIFVWDYNTGKSVRINSDKTVPTASIIKLPILFELFRLVDKGYINLNNDMAMEEHYRTSGSGHLQYGKSGQKLSISRLAALMIQDSDNSATNMLLAQIGGINSINRVMKQWGMNNTSLGNWLPDLTGTNVTTPEDMAKLLYNIDNPDLLSLQSRIKIVDIMSHVKNTSLIQAGLPSGVSFIHKTGNIGSMIGDAGIVELPTGRKYIVVIMVKRPHNSFAAKNYIVEASKIIYNYMSAF